MYLFILRERVHATTHVCVGDNLKELVLSFHWSGIELSSSSVAISVFTRRTTPPVLFCGFG